MTEEAKKAAYSLCIEHGMNKRKTAEWIAKEYPSQTHKDVRSYLKQFSKQMIEDAKSERFREAAREICHRHVNRYRSRRYTLEREFIIGAEEGVECFLSPIPKYE